MKKIIFNAFLIILLLGCATPPKTDTIERNEKNKTVKQDEAIASSKSSNIAGSAPKDMVSFAVGTLLHAAKNLLFSDNARAALEKINQAEAISPKTLVEEKIINQYKVVALVKLHDADAVEAMLNSQRVNVSQLGDVLKCLQVDNYARHNYLKAIQFGERYLVEINSDIVVLETVARSYYQQGNYRAASDRIKELLRQYERIGKVPEREIYEIWLDSSVKLNDSSGIKNAKEKISKLSSANEK